MLTSLLCGYAGGQVQFHVPQNIDMEDKIVGPLTMRQFIYLVIGGSIDYILFQRLAPEGQMALFLLIGAPIGLFFLALAFMKVQEQPFGEFLLAALNFTVRPRQRVWHREGQTDQPFTYSKDKQVVSDGQKADKKAPSHEELMGISKVLDSGGKDSVRKPSVKKMGL